MRWWSTVLSTVELHVVDPQLAVRDMRRLRRKRAFDTVGTTALGVGNVYRTTGRELGSVRARLTGLWAVIIVVRELDRSVVRARSLELVDGEGRGLGAARERGTLILGDASEKTVAFTKVAFQEASGRVASLAEALDAFDGTSTEVQAPVARGSRGDLAEVQPV